MAGMRQSEPRVSIGMPVYNGERFLRQAIDSILAQTFTDFELIISDNASTDATGEICRDYAAGDSRIRYIAQAVNRGAVWNINHLVTLARAPYYTEADADDMRAPRHLECCVAALDQAPPSVILVCSRGVFIDEHGRPTGPWPDCMDLRHPRPSERLASAIRNVGWCNVLFGLFHTPMLRTCRPLATYPHADHAQIQGLAIRGQFWEIPDELFYRRLHPNSSLRPDWTTQDAALYLDPQNTGTLILPNCQVFLDTMRAIHAADLPWSEAYRCRLALLREWAWPKRRAMRRELRYAARAWLRRFPTMDRLVSSIRRIPNGRPGVRAPREVPCRIQPAGAPAGGEPADAASRSAPGDR